MLPMLLLIFIIAAISPKLHRKHQHHAASPFLDHELNNTQVVISRASNEGSRRFHNLVSEVLTNANQCQVFVTTGEVLTLNCRVDRNQVISSRISKYLVTGKYRYS